MGARRKRRVDFEVSPRPIHSKCRSCGAAITWITTGEKPDGSPKRMPLHLGTAQVGLDGIARAESHFAHCPDAERHRRGGAA